MKNTEHRSGMPEPAFTSTFNWVFDVRYCLRPEPSAEGVHYGRSADMKTKRLYTVIVDYKGGTYCSQVMAIDEAYALVEWAQQIAGDEVLVAQFTKRGIHNLQKQDWIDEWRPVLLDGLVHVWCRSARVTRDLCLINVILTHPK